MAQIYETLKSLVSKEMVANAASTLGEADNKVKSAINVILPSHLGCLLKEGASPKIKEIVELAGKHDLIAKKDEIFGGSGIVGDVNPGERMENALLGSHQNAFMSEVAAKSGIKSDNADRLSNWVAGLIAGFFGEKIVKEKKSLPSLIGELEKEKKSFLDDVPANIYSKLGFASKFGSPISSEKKIVEKKIVEKKEDKPREKKGGNWIIWLIFILLLLLIFFWWRSCDKKKKAEAMVTNTEIAITPAVVNPVAAVAELKEVTLPDGKVLSIYKDGCEDRMLAYLNSDEYKNASAEDLMSKWFNFDYIDFNHDSATELTEGSYKQLNNIVEILKSYPNTKIIVGGFADKTGPDWANDEISKERAQHIKLVFNEGGIAYDRVATEGFSNDYAEAPATAPDSERVLDRHIALRFTK